MGRRITTFNNSLLNRKLTRPCGLEDDIVNFAFIGLQSHQRDLVNVLVMEASGMLDAMHAEVRSQSCCRIS